MLYVFHGADTRTVADRAHRLVAELREKHPGAQLFTFEGPLDSAGALDELVEARGLFVERHVVVIREPFADAASRDLTLARLERFAASDHLFVLTEGKVLVAEKRELERHATTIEECGGGGRKPQDFNVFALADALAVRDRRGLWVAYRAARRAGVEPENLCGTLHWALRSLLAAQHAPCATDAGMKDFTYGKFRRQARVFTRDELVSYARALIALYHDAHRGTLDLDVGLERWILGI